MLHLHCVFFFLIVCGQQLLKFFEFQNAHSKIFEKCVPAVFERKITQMVLFVLEAKVPMQRTQDVSDILVALR